ncbi:MAG TPA: FecR domain-containing protein [Verrucomicrobiae bacterium]
MATTLHAQTTPGKAEVRAVKGHAVYSIGGGPAMPLKVGTVLPTGATIKTGPDSSVDMFLGNSAGVLRVVENSTLGLDKLAVTDTGADTVVEVQLNLPEGTVLGNVNKLSAASRYEIKMPNGVAGIKGTRFRASSTMFIVLLEGTFVLVYVPPGGQPIPYTLVAPPAVYFSPIEGIKPAPPELVAEVGGQFGGRPFTPPGPPGGVPFRDPFVSPGHGPNTVNP